MDSEEKCEERMGREEINRRKRRRNLEDMVNTFEMDIGNQYTHYF